jgi:predicted ATPase
VPTEKSNSYIERIQVEGLYGQFNHDLSFGDHKPDNPNLLILYGENGTGKTTLLWLVYHLLNKEAKRGHRSYLARRQFKRVAVTFSDGVQLSADRENAAKGSFVMTLSRDEVELANFAFETSKDGTIPSKVSDDEEYMKFVEALPSFNFGFLPHDRSTRIEAKSRRNQRTQEGEEDLSPIQYSVSHAIGTARRQAIKASNQGQLTVNAIYTELIRQIALSPPAPPDSSVEEGRYKLLGRLEDQARITKEYSKFGLISDLQVEGLLETLKTMPPSRFQIVENILEPFLRGNEARLEALNVLYVALKAAVETLNSLYLNKQVTVHLEGGVTITNAWGSLLPDQLSSGEQELLILFCEVISALRPDTILFIDEPELSLNVTWQRTLLNSLLKCASGSTVQFVIATHSIEMLAQHRANVVRLSNETVGGAPPPLTTAEHSRG